MCSKGLLQRGSTDFVAEQTDTSGAAIRDRKGRVDEWEEGKKRRKRLRKSTNTGLQDEGRKGKIRGKDRLPTPSIHNVNVDVTDVFECCHERARLCWVL
ncbi:hypothetical protein PHSY_006975 [Pseudozyma hubeiensis SY62]|uniref:Uncharacterized protein n=1 Tax=Pseudozyma hubeiensis (strain SY62) TaxID=1305764 RepID=R9PDD8_PSEHS|nr:hypothetical protein PHSY_006975 [Pseudozyma hubeiensis SY62]GAC99374.1 hypothetical protein PHSY_006975 [Pseudozyma hubeiensis SY62]